MTQIITNTVKMSGALTDSCDLERSAVFALRSLRLTSYRREETSSADEIFHLFCSLCVFAALMGSKCLIFMLLCRVNLAKPA